ncbi:MAG TPA: hypothetical protein VNW29_02200 [Candidatus Sulfotelmatobacter sp.]|jgi:hypothetical protein|nr:hypothetical protein [Candidatus Sulfotelmatobacter sp.]
MKKIVNFAFFLLICISYFAPSLVFADPTSPHYIFKDYNFGGSNGAANSTNYSLLGTVGEGVAGKTNSPNYSLGDGLAFTLNAYVPPAPTITNPANYYNKLNLVINAGSNATDTKFAIAVSPDNFTATTKYIQTDYTLGGTAIWQTKATWGATGFTIIGLTPGTTYTAKISALQGNFTQSAFGPTAQATTVSPTLSFSLSQNSVSIGQLNPATVVTAPATVTVTVSSNGTNGTVVYLNDSSNGLFSTATNYTIAAVNGDLGSLSEGYGIRGASTSQTSGGPMEILSPYNGIGTTVGNVTTTKQAIFDSSNQPITTGQALFEIKAKASNITKAATDYTDTITLVTAATF